VTPSAVLAVGNYLNGGTNRGQADGFDLETLTKLDTIKDVENSSKDVRHFIFEIFFLGIPLNDDVNPKDLKLLPRGTQLVHDFAPLLRSVSRVVVRDNEGCFKVCKNARVAIEDTESAARKLIEDFTSRYESLQMYLQYSDDPADPMKLDMVEQFSVAKTCMERLDEQLTRSRNSYNDVLKYLFHKGMKSSDFALLWDNLLVPGGLILSKPEMFQKKEILPRFCRPTSAPNIEDILVLWELFTPTEAKKHTRKHRVLVRHRREKEAHETPETSVARLAQLWRKTANMRKTDRAAGEKSDT